MTELIVIAGASAWVAFCAGIVVGVMRGAVLRDRLMGQISELEQALGGRDGR